MKESNIIRDGSEGIENIQLQVFHKVLDTVFENGLGLVINVYYNLYGTHKNRKIRNRILKDKIKLNHIQCSVKTREAEKEWKSEEKQKQEQWIENSQIR